MCEKREYQTMHCFSVEVMLKVYHVCKDILVAVSDEELPCQREDSNHVGPFVVAVIGSKTLL